MKGTARESNGGGRERGWDK